MSLQSMSHPFGIVVLVPKTPEVERDKLKCFITALDADCLDNARAAQLYKTFGEIEQLAAGARLIVASKAVASRAWEKDGYRDGASWMAALGGQSYGEAAGTLATAQQLGKLPVTDGALRRGELSVAQARKIAGAAHEDPSSESLLVDSARKGSFEELEATARLIRTQAAKERSLAATERRARQRRSLWGSSDDFGSFHLHARLTAQDGARVMDAIEKRAGRFFDEARSQSRREPHGAYLADALVEACTEECSGAEKPGAQKSPKTTTVLRVDLAALKRESLGPEESCTIDGVGPVSLATATNLIGDSWLKILVTSGVDVQSITHVGRTIPAHVRSALEARDQSCVVPRCSVRRHLEIDHYKVPFALGGRSELSNLARLCTFHHRLKTHAGFVLDGGPGHWVFRPPSESGDDDDDQWPDRPESGAGDASSERLFSGP
ncbi:MAG: HNH endonuclease signature motif containing protein [Acidimicrobiales bacterium]